MADYLLYGEVHTVRQEAERAILVTLRIECEADDILTVAALQPTTSVLPRRLTYMELPVSRHEGHITVEFAVHEDTLCLVEIAGKSTEGPFPFAVTYAIYNQEVIHLSENDIVELKGSTYVCPHQR
jgi:hypothetical protein